MLSEAYVAEQSLEEFWVDTSTGSWPSRTSPIVRARALESSPSLRPGFGLLTQSDQPRPGRPAPRPHTFARRAYVAAPGFTSRECRPTSGPLGVGLPRWPLSLDSRSYLTSSHLQIEDVVGSLVLSRSHSQPPCTAPGTQWDCRRTKDGAMRNAAMTCAPSSRAAALSPASSAEGSLISQETAPCGPYSDPRHGASVFGTTADSRDPHHAARSFLLSRWCETKPLKADPAGAKEGSQQHRARVCCTATYMWHQRARLSVEPTRLHDRTSAPGYMKVSSSAAQPKRRPLLMLFRTFQSVLQC